MRTTPRRNLRALLWILSGLFSVDCRIHAFSLKKLATAGRITHTKSPSRPVATRSRWPASKAPLEEPVQVQQSPLLERLIIRPESPQKVNGYSMPNGQSSQYHDRLDAKGTFWTTVLGPKPVAWPAHPNNKRNNNKASEEEEDEDGFWAMQGGNQLRRRRRRRRRNGGWRAYLAGPLQKSLAWFTRKVEPGTLILVRHGESTWNANKTFTGWADPDLSERGLREVEHAARLLLEGGYEIDVVFTSRLKRAIRSTWIILQELNEVYLPVFKSWRLNERMYGALTGLSKFETAQKLGANLVQEWRGSLRLRPPSLKSTDAYWPGHERKYADLAPEQIPLTESLLDCMARTQPLWEEKILYELRNGRNVMVVAHANTLRGLVKTIDHIGDEDIQEVAIPTGIPIIYKFDQQMQPIPPQGGRQTASQVHMNGLFLEKPGLLKEALEREEEWSKQVPGYNPTMHRTKTPMTALERSLFKLQAERELGEWAGQFLDPNNAVEDDGNDGNRGKPMQIIFPASSSSTTIKASLSSSSTQTQTGAVPHHTFVPTVLQSDDPLNSTMDAHSIFQPQAGVVANLMSSSSTQPCVVPTALGSNGDLVPVRHDPVVVIIRHGKTEHNKLGLFTGWEDAPLAKEGVEEAREAGRLLKAHGMEFDVVYCSWLSRAIETAWHVIDEMDCLWLPIIKSWRLNERMYGALTGLSKQMVKQRHGEKQFKAWRRGYSTPPPPVSSFSQHYPGNDRRYVKYLNDIRFSVRESVIRSIEQGRPTLHRKFPKSESLKDCMDRTIPFFTNCIYPDAIQQGKRVLISSSENAIRGLLMHLCDIPEDKITELEIPNGLPIIFDVKNKCVKLLDDGTGRDPLEVHNFGKAASYLFRPCLNEDGSPDEECEIRYSMPTSSSSSSSSTTSLSETSARDSVVPLATTSPISSTYTLSAEEQAVIDAIKGPRVPRS